MNSWFIRNGSCRRIPKAVTVCPEGVERVERSSEIKQRVSGEETFDKLDIRLGQIVDVRPEPSAPKPACRLIVDFGGFGPRVGIGRFTGHSMEEIRGMKFLAVLNLEPRRIGDVVSEVLGLGVQYPKADSGEAAFIVPEADAGIGGNLF
jgi:tRNA-binding protein